MVGPREPHYRQVILWRQRLERKGWRGLRRGIPPSGALIEYHVIWNRQLISGRVRLRDTDRNRDYWIPGTPEFLLSRRYGIDDGVWRPAKGGPEPGQLRRPLPWHEQ